MNAPATSYRRFVSRILLVLTTAVLAVHVACLKRAGWPTFSPAAGSAGPGKRGRAMRAGPSRE